MIALAQSVSISIGGANLDACGPRARAVRGRLTVSAALNVLLAGSDCVYEQIGPSSFRVRLKARLPAPAKAAAPKPAEPTALGEMVVTGYRRPELLGHAAAAVSVVSAHTLSVYPDDLATSAALVSGLAVTNLGPGRDKIVLRGLSDGVFDGHTQSTVGLYLDDTPIQYDAPDPDLLLVDLARIEVLKGPQGALYGEGSISGVVRLVTNPPDLAKSSAELSAGGALTLGGGPSSRLTATLNEPLVRDRVAVRATAYDDESGGFIKDLGLGQSNINQTQRYGGRIAVKAQLDPDWTVSGEFTGQELSSRNSQYVSGDLGPYVRRTPMAEPHDNDFGEGAATLSGQTRLGALKISLNHLHHALQSRFGADNVADRLATPVAGPIAYDESRHIELTTAEATLTSPDAGPLAWLAGVFAASSRERFDPQLTDLTSHRVLYVDARLDRVESQALFGEVTFKPVAHLTLTAGGRLSTTRVSVDSTSTEATGGGAVTRSIADDQSATQFASKFVASYDLTPQATLFAQASDGFRSGGFNTDQLLSDRPAPVRYGGDRLNNYEAGLKLRSDDQRGLLSLIGLYEVWRNIQSDQLLASGLPMTVNVGDGRNIGVEAEGSWTPIDPIDVRAALQINDPRLTRANPPYSSLDDPGLPYIGRLNWSVSSTWRSQLAGAPLESMAALVYRGPSHLNFGRFGDAAMGGYTTLNFSSTAVAGGARYTVRIDNALNAKANSFAYGNPFTLPAGPQATPIRPATLWLTAAYGF